MPSRIAPSLLRSLLLCLLAASCGGSTASSADRATGGQAGSAGAGVGGATAGQAGNAAGSPTSAGQGGSTAGAGGGAAGSAGEKGAAAGAGGESGFVPAPTNVPTGALCEIPPDYVKNGGDPANPKCAIASDALSDRDPAVVPSALLVAAWNVEFGQDEAAIEATLQTNPKLANADVLLLSEVARASQTSTPKNIDQARVLAEKLKLNYAFAVEWDRREKPDELGEHGVAVLSKYPLGNLTQLRLAPLNDWYASDQLYGGRVALGADLLVGGKTMRVYVAHLCTRGTGGAGRAKEAAEVRADADLPFRPTSQVIGGDLNTWTCNPTLGDCTKPPAAEQTVQEFLAAGWKDGTAGFQGWTQLGKGVFPQRLDWLFHRGSTATPGASVGDTKGSDHYAVYMHVSPP